MDHRGEGWDAGDHCLQQASGAAACPRAGQLLRDEPRAWLIAHQRGHAGSAIWVARRSATSWIQSEAQARGVPGSSSSRCALRAPFQSQPHPWCTRTSEWADRLEPAPGVGLVTLRVPEGSRRNRDPSLLSTGCEPGGIRVASQARYRQCHIYVSGFPVPQGRRTGAFDDGPLEMETASPCPSTGHLRG